VQTAGEKKQFWSHTSGPSSSNVEQMLNGGKISEKRDTQVFLETPKKKPHRYNPSAVQTLTSF
jgi:hypothetical protein